MPRPPRAPRPVRNVSTKRENLLKKLAAILVLLMSALAFAACGGEKELTPDTLAAAMDEVCAATNAEFDALGTRGTTTAGLVAEFQGRAEVRQGQVDGLRELNVSEEARAGLDEYVGLTEKMVAQDGKIAEVATEDDNDALDEAFKEHDALGAQRDQAVEELGLEVCGAPAEMEVEETGTAPPEDLEYAEPDGTIEEAVQAYLANWQDGDCSVIVEDHHTDSGDPSGGSCEQAVPLMKGARAEGSEQYGPVGQAEIVREDGTHIPTTFVQDLDGELRWAGDAVHDAGGMRKAPEDNDSQESIDATVAAIRDNDGKAFNELLPDQEGGFVIEGGGRFDTFSDGEYNAAFVADVRASDRDPVQLGLNSAFGYYLLPGEKHDWVLGTIHAPGTGSEYRFQSYLPIPKP